MPHHIGIVACSAEGAALCYRTICVEGAQLLGPHDHPEVSMHTHSLAEYMKCIYRGDWQGVGELMLASANKLAKIGADFLICPDNTIHQAPRPNRNSLAGRERSLSRKAHGGRTRVCAPERCRMRRNQSDHHGGVGLRHV